MALCSDHWCFDVNILEFFVVVVSWWGRDHGDQSHREWREPTVCMCVGAGQTLQ